MSKFEVVKMLLASSLLIGGMTVAQANASRNATFELYERLQQMEGKVQSLNGEVEMLTNQLHTLQQRQLAQFKDLDSRLGQLAQQPQGAAPMAAATKQSSTINLAPPAAATVSAPETQTISNDKAAYQAAYAHIREKRYPQATQSMHTFLKVHPKSAYAANAHYWLGELDLLAGDINAAMQEFDAIVSKHPQHSKVADAMLKLGYIYDDIGQFSKSKIMLQQLQTQFPGSTAAQLATKRLQQMQRSA